MGAADGNCVSDLHDYYAGLHHARFPALVVAGALPSLFLEGSCVPSYILRGRLYFIILAWQKKKKKTLFRTEFILFVYLFIPVNQLRKKSRSEATVAMKTTYVFRYCYYFFPRGLSARP